MLQTDVKLQRLDFANTFLIKYDEYYNWPLRIQWIDESHFSLTGHVNSKNCVQWVENNPHDVAELPLHEKTVTV